VRVSRESGKVLRSWARVLPRYPKSLVWNAYLTGGQVFNRDGFGGEVHASWESIHRLNRDGLLVVLDVTAEAVWTQSARTTYLKMELTDEGRAALVVWSLTYGEEM